MIKKINGKWINILDSKVQNKDFADFHFKKHDSNEVKQTIRLGDRGPALDLSSAFRQLIVQTEQQLYIAFEFQNNHYIYRTMPFRTEHSQILHPFLSQNQERLKNTTQEVLETLKYFGFTINTEKSETESKQTIIVLGWEWNLENSTVQTKPKKRLLLLLDLYNMRKWIKIRTEKTVKQSAKLIGKPNSLRLQFQVASLFLNIMDHQKAFAAKQRGWNTTMTMNKTAIPDINWWAAQFRANIPTQLIQILSQIIMVADAAPSGWDSTLERELEMIEMAHRTWNKSYAKLSNNNREIKAITQGLRSFAKTLKNSRVQSLAIRSDNSTAVFNIRKWRETSTMIKEIKQVNQSIEKQGIQIQITHLPGVKNEIADALSRLLRAGDYKLTKNIFQQTRFPMNLNQAIDLFSQHFNNLLPRFMSTI
ncbi:MAG: hypothetical protein EZS28_005039 [Streblomastix strix]|uniref:Transposon Ty3-I Gag-Pol polyprotein n=1 Tax=Streblomastix strix TaxID=222440 RepID=A0A5J4WX70_9EUKA|nr:MAG: hypothetical protein EZS28_005039 [Streblomastix strix]